MSRLARGNSEALPDVGTLTKLSSWLGLPFSDLIAEQPTGPVTSVLEASTPDIVEVHLRADKNLTPDAAKALAQTFKAIYDQVRSHGVPK